MEGELALFIPIVLFIVIGVVLALRQYYQHRTAREIQTTVRAAIEHGTPLSPELIERLTPLPPKNADLRRGVISITVALAVGAFSYFIDEPEAQGPMLGLACFPLFIGIAYLALWKFNSEDDATNARPTHSTSSSN